MAIEKVRACFKEYGIEDRILEFDVSSATVELAAAALGCAPKRIAKTLSFMVKDTPILIVAAGDAKIDNPKYKAKFQTKAKMLEFEQVEELVGHAVGGVCPFAIKEGVEVYLDESLKRFKTVFPACGSANSAIELSLEELEKYSGYSEWVDVCKIPQYYLLFDLDGTLTDPMEGITKSVQHALRAFDIEEPDLQKLTPFIGPPLKDSFMEFYGFDEAKAEEAIARYRERFRDVGIFENKVYEGIPEVLAELKNQGCHLAVASSKPEIFVKQILEHFAIAEYFEVVVGSELDGRRTDKAEVVHEALNQLYGEEPDSESTLLKKKTTYMVGDRKFDIIGAKKAGLKSVGVSFGYGPREELEAEAPDYIVDTVPGLMKVL